MRLLALQCNCCWEPTMTMRKAIRGQLQLIIGPMFSGKSTELIRRMRRFQHAKLECLVVKYKLDDRYSEEKMSTHDKQMFKAAPVARLEEIRQHIDQYDVIGIDEGQFFPDLLEFCDSVANSGKTVIVAALDGTFERKPFGSVCSLIPSAEQVIKLNAVCTECGRDAAFTRRIVADKSIELIGGSDMYEPRNMCTDVLVESGTVRLAWIVVAINCIIGTSERTTMSKLASAAAQQLKGVIVEYDALCSTLLGKGAAAHAEAQRRKQREAAEAAKKLAELSPATAMFGRVKDMFVTDVRSLLKDLQQDSTGKPWVVKDRLQSTLNGLPAHMLDKVTSDGTKKTDEEQYLEQQLSSASAAESALLKEAKPTVDKAAERLRLLQQEKKGAGGNAIRGKYLDKLNKLKAKAKAGNSGNVVAATDTGVAKGLSTWVVNRGANELLSYAGLRGLAKAVIPNRSPLQDEEFELFMKEVRHDPTIVVAKVCSIRLTYIWCVNQMEMQFDQFMPQADVTRFPDPEPIHLLCEKLGFAPLEVLVVARNPQTIRAAKEAGAHCCQFMLSEDEMPNHTAQYQISHLADFQYIVEDFNGISYRGRSI
ncbi:TPA: hypothetical protein N0F65_013067 [Lagenidium giganteum]|uniref:thymidine kinase n=1 Tax=Lagenidium giganteum TaxID=4803 RepID=A0AAV2YFN0_9STRA|nr:TPA: hypothetical protein N0F65_013067 [Lagenidium giganteum]